jgi:hypothetical protein
MWKPQLSPLPPSGTCHREGGGLHSRQGSHPLQQLVLERHQALVVGGRRPDGPQPDVPVGGGRPDQRELHRQHALGIEAGVHAEQASDALEHEPRAGEQHQGQRQVEHHQGPARSGRRRADTGAGPAGQRLARVVGGCSQRRSEPEEQPRRDREPGGEGEHPQVDRRLVEAGDRERRRPREAALEDDGQSQAGAAARQREQAALGQQLADQPPPARPERGADRQLPGPPRRSREQKARDVRARHQQHEADRAQQQVEGRAYAAADQLVERRDRHRAGRVVLRMLRRELAADRVEVGPGLLERDALADAPERLEVLAAAAGVVQRHVVAERRPHLRPRVEVRRDQRLEAGGQHAHHFEVPVVHGDAAADDVAARSEAAPPQPVAQHHHPPALRMVVLPPEVAPQRRAHAEHREVVPAHAHRRHALGLVALREGRGPQADRRHRFEAARAVAQVLERGEPEVRRPPIAAPVAQRHQPLRRVVGQRPQQRRVHQVEDRRVPADAEGEGQRRGQREAGSTTQGARAIAQVLEQRLEERDPRLIAIRLGDLQRPAEPASRLAASLLGPQSAAQELLLRHLEMEAQLLGQLRLAAPAGEEARDAREQLPQRAHRAPSGPSTRAITSTTRRQSAASRSSCFLPVRVRL